LTTIDLKVGDLISFKPVGFGNDDWSNPGIVLEQYAAPDEELWVVWVDGMKCVIHDNEHYEIMYLTSS
tara:strand:+ start:223 stop:426 length:204 start_codon:yes stop_codon:yes gene_type:complete